MTTSPDSLPPDEAVADRIVKRFVEAGLLPEPLVDAVRRGLAQGSLRDEDWRLYAERALEIDEREDSQ